MSTGDITEKRKRKKRTEFNSMFCHNDVSDSPVIDWLLHWTDVSMTKNLNKKMQCVFLSPWIIRPPSIRYRRRSHAVNRTRRNAEDVSIPLSITTANDLLQNGFNSDEDELKEHWWSRSSRSLDGTYSMRADRNEFGLWWHNCWRRSSTVEDRETAIQSREDDLVDGLALLQHVEQWPKRNFHQGEDRP